MTTSDMEGQLQGLRARVETLEDQLASLLNRFELAQAKVQQLAKWGDETYRRTATLDQRLESLIKALNDKGVA